MPKCLECGAEFERKPKAPQHGLFCQAKHRKDWNNRRAIRGAMLYDLYMEQRYNRAEGKEQSLMTIQSNLARAFRDADNAKRAGRQSWDSQAAKRLPLAYGKHGDNR